MILINLKGKDIGRVIYDIGNEDNCFGCPDY